MARPINKHLLSHRQFIHDTKAGCNCEHFFYRRFEDKQKVLVEYGESPSGEKVASNPYDFLHYQNGVLQNKRVGIATATDFDAWLVEIGLLDAGVKTNEIA